MRIVSNLSLVAKLLTMFTAVFAAAALSSFVSRRSLGTIEEANGWRDHTYRVLEQVEALAGAMVNRETGLRGYLLAADERFLEPYRTGGAGWRRL